MYVASRCSRIPDLSIWFLASSSLMRDLSLAVSTASFESSSPSHSIDELCDKELRIDESNRLVDAPTN